MALDKEKVSRNELLLPNSAEQSEVRLQFQCSKNYLLAMLQDSPDGKNSFSRPPIKPSTSRIIQPAPTSILRPAPPRPVLVDSVLMGISKDGQRLLLLPPNHLNTQIVSKLPMIAAPTAINNGSEKVTPPKRPLDGQDADKPKTEEASQPKEEQAPKKDKTEEETSKPKEPAPKKKRVAEMGPRCQCKMSLLSKKFHCNDFTEEERKSLFEDFWDNHNSKQRKEVVCSLVKCGLPNARRRAGTDPSRKELSFQYFLKRNGQMQRVCKVMFLTTLSMGDSTVRDWVMCSMTEKPYVNL